MANKIQVRRGLKSNMPTLSVGEIGYATDTRETYIGTGSGNVNMGGGYWYCGTAMSGTSTTTGAYSYSACPQVKLGDLYLNASYGYVYQCTTAGSGTSAKWTYKGNIKGNKGDTGAKGEKGANAATIVVAASDSKNTASADYICTGTADQNQINAAIAALPSGGGKIVLLDGTYNISGSITVNKDNVTIEGMGNGTVLQTSSNISVIYVGSSNCEIRNLSVSCTASDRCGYGIYVAGSSSIIENICSTHFVHNIYLASVSDYAIVTKCYLSDGEGVAVCSKCCIISDNYIENYEYAGIYLNGSSYCNITGNILKDMGWGIFLEHAAQYNKVSNNYILRGTGTSADYPSDTYSIYIITGTYNYLSDNYIPGKNYINNGGTTNTFSNNRYE